MSILSNKIDFAVVVEVRDANPNGDPLDGNRPRTSYDNFGEISDVCIKRKLRNRLQDMGEEIFVKSDDRSDDGFTSLSERAKANLSAKMARADYAKKACELWYDVRAFGQVFAYSADRKNNDDEGVSVGVRGPVSVHQAISAAPVEIVSQQITKSVNGEPAKSGKADKKSSDTMGMKHRVRYGVYTIKGSINVQLAQKTGFTEEDAEKLKEALRTLFVNDASSARPDGSMEVVNVFWWKHNNQTGQYSSAKVHRTLAVKQIDTSATLDSKEKSPEPMIVLESPDGKEKFSVTLSSLEGLTPEILQGM